MLYIDSFLLLNYAARILSSFQSCWSQDVVQGMVSIEMKISDSYTENRKDIR